LESVGESVSVLVMVSLKTYARIGFFAALPPLGMLSSAMGDAAPERVEFNRDIRPILSENCFRCHGFDRNQRKAKLRLDIRESAIGGGDNGRDKSAVVPGHPEQSQVMHRLLSQDPEELMPPPESEKSVSAAERELIRRWIAQGAEYEDHWAYERVERPVVPIVGDWESWEDWVGNPIDAFIAARLQVEGLEPSPAADARTLARRLSFDVAGLPLDPNAVDVFTESKDPASFDSLVVSLLESPAFGERMAVSWLDIVRYADTVGIHGDQTVTISPYRDYVIKAFNDNMPFDQFTIEQLAGDLLPEPTLIQLAATGFNRLNLTTHEGGAQSKEYLAKYAADRVRATSTVWMGSTMGCAECHDHKYDPFGTVDFYSFAAFFADVEEQGAYSSGNSNPCDRPPAIRVPEYATMRDYEVALASVDQVRSLEPAFTPTLITKAVEPRTMRVLPRGNWLDDSGDEVSPAVPDFFAFQPQGKGERRLTRLDLAKWFAHRDHPLTARVFVNRLWKLYFGTGLSKVLDDLGSQGEWPVHPELLDWLAIEFMESGWDVKHIVRLMVSSSTYRQSSMCSDSLRERDPDNRLLARQTSRRLDAELIRDNALKSSGLLVLKLGGKSVRPYQPERYYMHLNFPTRTYAPSDDDGQWRRGVYTHWQRLFLHPAMVAFDAPSREECVAERPYSNTPLAALVSLNDPTYVEAARVLAGKAIARGGVAEIERVKFVFREVLARVPQPAEEKALLELFSAEQANFASDPDAARELVSIGFAPRRDLPVVEHAAWTSVARAVLNLHETITRF